MLYLGAIFSVFYKQLIQYFVAVYVSFTITLRNDGLHNTTIFREKLKKMLQINYETN